MTLVEVASKFSNESAAWEYVEELRWNGHPECPRCGSDDVFFMAPRSDQPRTTRTGTTSFRRLWRCRGCKKQFSVLIGTIFEGTKIPLSKWLMGIYLMSAGKNGVAALELQRDLGITYKSAWFMVHRIRQAMANAPIGNKMFGTVVADETWVGGKPSNRHASKQPTEGERIGAGGTGRPSWTDKQPVLSMVNVETGEVRSRVVGDVTGSTLRKAMAEHVDFASTDLHTDESHSYWPIASEFRSHSSVNHKAGEYVRGGVSTNKVEGFFSQFKRSLDGTHHHVSREHLQRYANEFDFRYSTRKLSDGERGTNMVARADGAYLSYRRLISTGPVAMGTRPRPVGRPGPR